MKYDYLKLAEIIKKKREEKGLSMRKLAEKIGVSHTEISRIEGGMKAQFSFVILVKICKALDIDVMNLLDDIGLWEVDYDKLFYVMFKTNEEKIFKVHARCEYEAARIALDFVTENNLMDFSSVKKNLLLGIVENPQDFNKDILDHFEKTGKLPNENIEETNEDFDDFDEEIDDNSECDSCEYCCPTCGRCTYGD